MVGRYTQSVTARMTLLLLLDKYGVLEGVDRAERKRKLRKILLLWDGKVADPGMEPKRKLNDNYVRYHEELFGQLKDVGLLEERAEEDLAEKMKGREPRQEDCVKYKLTEEGRKLLQEEFDLDYEDQSIKWKEETKIIQETNNEKRAGMVLERFPLISQHEVTTFTGMVRHAQIGSHLKSIGPHRIFVRNFSNVELLYLSPQ